MQFCICASGCSPFTTSSRKLGTDKDEKKPDFARTEVRALCSAIRHGVWLCGDAPVELADARFVWLAPDQFLASGRPFGFEQDPLWRVPRPSGVAYVLATPHDGAMGAH